MIIIDMRMPLHCRDCPCSYYIQTGPYIGQLMCCVMEYRGMPAAECLLEPEGQGRPAGCPLREKRRRSSHGKVKHKACGSQDVNRRT